MLSMISYFEGPFFRGCVRMLLEVDLGSFLTFLYRRLFFSLESHLFDTVSSVGMRI